MTRRTILVVEDNDNIRSAYAALLERGGYRTIEAANGLEGIRLARERCPDLILLDMMMPGLDGGAVSETLKGSPETARIPIVAVTAQTLRREQERMRMYCDGYLLKPVPPEVMLNEVARFLGVGAANG